jgi:ATP-dependent RNA circularization protein (DNA/RNA ligase family)
MKNPKFVKYPEIPHLAETLEILDSKNLVLFEKLDGGNTQVRTYQGRILTGNRANFLTREERFRFLWFKDFNNWAKSNHSFGNLPENLIIYGEFTAPHSLNYFPGFTNKFFLIDVYQLDQGRFIPYEDAVKTLEGLGIQNVFFPEILARGGISLDQAKELAMGESKYSAHGREGIVVKDYDSQKFAKLWRTSVDKTESGLADEVKKTIGSLSASGLLTQIPSSREDVDSLASMVLTELQRSGRIDKSLAEITDTIRKFAN